MTAATVTRLQPSTAPKPPAGLKADGKRLWTELQRAYGIVDAGGLLLLETACKSYQDWQEARAAVAKDGLLVPDRQGGTKAHPAAKIVESSHRSMMAALRGLHLDIEPLQDRPGRPSGR
jgi:P27 family predicted phage terminase small subunit